MPSKIKVAILYGGSSCERSVSLVTGQAIFENLDRTKYQATLVELTPKNHFLIRRKEQKIFLDLLNKDRKKFDLFFIALHGSPGEDGAVQGLLQLLGIPFTGSDVLASALAMDKVKTGEIYRVYGIPTPELRDFTRLDWKKNKENILAEIRQKIGFPAVLKPVNQGSAIGVKIVQNEVELVKNVPKLLVDFPYLMAQRFIPGAETTCGVLEKKGVAFALPPTHIKPNLNGFYDFASKYKAGGSIHICPADFAPEINQKLQELAVRAHQALGCRGMSRTDIRVNDQGECFVLETNTIPGMTPTSLLPEAAQKGGIYFAKMLDLMIDSCYFGDK